MKDSQRYNLMSVVWLAVLLCVDPPDPASGLFWIVGITIFATFALGMTVVYRVMSYCAERRERAENGPCA